MCHHARGRSRSGCRQYTARVTLVRGRVRLRDRGDAPLCLSPATCVARHPATAPPLRQVSDSFGCPRSRTSCAYLQTLRSRPSPFAPRGLPQPSSCDLASAVASVESMLAPLLALFRRADPAWTSWTAVEALLAGDDCPCSSPARHSALTWTSAEASVESALKSGIESASWERTSRRAGCVRRTPAFVRSRPPVSGSCAQETKRVAHTSCSCESTPHLSSTGSQRQSTRMAEHTPGNLNRTHGPCEPGNTVTKGRVGRPRNQAHWRSRCRRLCAWLADRSLDVLLLAARRCQCLPSHCAQGIRRQPEPEHQPAPA